MPSAIQRAVKERSGNQINDRIGGREPSLCEKRESGNLNGVGNNRYQPGKPKLPGSEDMRKA